MKKKIFEVVFSGKAWVFRHRGGEPIASFATREEAVQHGRETCGSNRPSRLRVGKKPTSDPGI